jgi:hypothetical protein
MPDMALPDKGKRNLQMVTVRRKSVATDRLIQERTACLVLLMSRMGVQT